MEKIYRSTAHRAGGRITVNGFNGSAHGPPRKVVGVDKIEFGEGKAIATDRTGTRYELVTD